ncbi:MAG TPA: sigma-70 factor domain-containing protein, partial [Polyangiaceae bacterium]|nr:sigma-70 factor domain-containing protein [Polyangiaceae bacterium]
MKLVEARERSDAEARGHLRERSAAARPASAEPQAAKPKLAERASVAKSGAASTREKNSAEARSSAREAEEAQGTPAPVRTRASEDAQQEAPAPREEPSAEDLEEVEKETAKAINDLERTDRSMLGRYFREMASHRVLSPDEELEAARRIHQLEVAYWRALLSHVPAFETVARVVERHLEEVPADVATLRKLAKGCKKALAKKEQTRWDELAEVLSLKMRELDADRIFVAESQKAVERLAGTHTAERDMVVGEFQVTAAFRKYLTDVRRAQRAQQEAKNRFVTANL